MKRMNANALLIIIAVILVAGLMNSWAFKTRDWHFVRYNRYEHEEFVEDMEDLGDDLGELGEEMGELGAELGYELGDVGSEFGHDMSDWGGSDFGRDMGHWGVLTLVKIWESLDETLLMWQWILLIQ